ncbi:hypothetical protein SVIOM342S_05537 [Streptomyces violaceorubidus]
MRRLGVVTTLYAVFLAGRWVGPAGRGSDGCVEDRITAGSDGRPTPVEPAHPGRDVDNLDLGF